MFLVFVYACLVQTQISFGTGNYRFCLYKDLEKCGNLVQEYDFKNLKHSSFLFE